MGRFICRRSVWSHAPLQRRSTVRRSDGYIQVIPNLKTLRLQGHGIICPLPTRHGVPDLLNSTAKQTHEMDQGKAIARVHNARYANSRLEASFTCTPAVLGLGIRWRRQNVCLSFGPQDKPLSPGW